MAPRRSSLATPRTLARDRFPCSLLLAFACLQLAGCALFPKAPPPERPQFSFRSQLVLKQVSFEIWYDAGDAEALPMVREALTQAAGRVTAWGSFVSPVVLRLYPNHATLEAAVHRYDYPWLRAWARYDEIFLQSPQSYSIFESGEANLSELLTHELTHCLMYQQAAPRGRWRQVDRQIPIWFREGMASWTASQGKRRASEARLRAWILQDRRNPLSEAQALYQDEAGWVYAAGHWAFSLLVEQYGIDAIHQLLAALLEGRGFGSAFRLTTGISLSSFEDELLLYLLWEGFRERRHPSPPELFQGARVGATSAAG